VAGQRPDHQLPGGAQGEIAKAGIAPEGRGRGDLRLYWAADTLQPSSAVGEIGELVRKALSSLPKSGAVVALRHRAAAARSVSRELHR